MRRSMVLMFCLLVPAGGDPFIGTPIHAIDYDRQIEDLPLDLDGLGLPAR